MDYFKGDYLASLNSEDLLDPELILKSNKSKGGTMIMWRKSLDPFITIYYPETSGFLLLVLDIPNVQTMVHIVVYLPTAGKDVDYLSDLSKLKIAFSYFCAPNRSEANRVNLIA